MLSITITRIEAFLKDKLEESKILFAYRYISLFITSFFYLLNHSEHEPLRKIIIIGCISIAAVILSFLYTIYEKSPRNIFVLLIIETIGNIVLLIPSGGINSPFIWYTLNTILISSMFLKKRYCWINFLVYLLGYGIIIEFGTDFSISLSGIIKEQSNLLLSFIMIIVAVQILAIYINKTKDEGKRLESANELIIESLFERLFLEEINQRLLITEEQNRIANEIHDSILQRLFSMSCGIFSLMKNLSKHSTEEIEDSLNLFRENTDIIMKELREKIYGLSWKKSDHSSFSLDIKRYIEDVGKLSSVNIPFNFIGNIETLTGDQKKAIYRIISEGIGNAVRHGNAMNIEVSLNITSENSNLVIIDDGRGFDLEKVLRNPNRGLGIQNLYQLTESLQGQIHIESKAENGTTIEVLLPNNVELLKGEAAL